MNLAHYHHVFVVALLVGTGRVTAECPPPPPLCESAARADLVFFGEVLQVTTYLEQTERGALPQGIQAVRFKVIRPFKGVEPTDWWGFFYFGLGSDTRALRPGARYLVFAERRATGAFVRGAR